VVCRDDEADRREHRDVRRGHPFAAHDSHQRHQRDAVHADALVPAQLARRVVRDLAEVQAAQHRRAGQEQREPHRVLAGDPHDLGTGRGGTGDGHGRREHERTREGREREHRAEHLHRLGVHSSILPCRGGRMVGVTTATSVGIAALRDMRTDRRKRRVADMEWFELLYRVYLAALIGGFVILYLSSLVQDAPFTASQFDAVITDGPRAAGLVMAVVWFLGMRSGAQGGPVNVEDAEVRHVLPARRASSSRSACQRTGATVRHSSSSSGRSAAR